MIGRTPVYATTRAVIEIHDDYYLLSYLIQAASIVQLYMLFVAIVELRMGNFIYALVFTDTG